MRNDNAANNFEDDTEAAPVLSVKVNPNNETRELNGTVWEDARGDKEEGDGIYTPKAEGAETGDETIDGVDVTLVEKINVTPSDVDHIKEYANNPEICIYLCICIFLEIACPHQAVK